MAKGKYAKLPQLYVTGDVLELKDGSVLWLQVLNPYEMHEVRTDAQAAKSRLVLALKDEDAGSEERIALEGQFYELGRVEIIRQLAELHTQRELPMIISRLEDDSDWKERVQVMNRSEDILSRPPEDPEAQLLEKINREFLEEVAARQESERNSRMAEFGNYTNEDLIAELIDVVIEHRGNERASEEYALSEATFAARSCDAVRDADGNWVHEGCNHAEQIWTKAEVRALPGELQDLIFMRMRELNLSVREAKNSDRQGSSSDSSPLPSEPVESIPSTSPVTPEEVPGSSATPSITR